MTAATVPLIPKAATDERLARRSPLIRLMIRPEFGALAGAIVVLAAVRLAGRRHLAVVAGHEDVRRDGGAATASRRSPSRC